MRHYLEDVENVLNFISSYLVFYWIHFYFFFLVLTSKNIIFQNHHLDVLHAETIMSSKTFIYVVKTLNTFV